MAAFLQTGPDFFGSIIATSTSLLKVTISCKTVERKQDNRIHQLRLRFKRIVELDQHVIALY